MKASQPKPGHFHVTPDIDWTVICDRCGEPVSHVSHELQNVGLDLYWNICPACKEQIDYADTTREN